MKSPPGPAPLPPTLAELSPLVVAADLRLYLPAYANREVALTPLPKALLLFFLTQPPAGLRLPELAEHQPALLAFYCRLQPGLDAATAAWRIRELTDVRRNSLHEKCSRIKEAFTRLLDERLARCYYVRGRRGGPKGVALPRELLHWP